MTTDETGWTGSAFARFMIRVPLLLSKRLWIWPLVGAIVLGGVGFWVRNRMEGAIQAELTSSLQTLLNADVAALRLWFSEQELDAKSFAADVRVQEAIVQLAVWSANSNCTPATLYNSPAAKTLQLYLLPALKTQHYLDYVVIGADKRILASPSWRMVGRQAQTGYDLFLDKAMAGELAISRPFARELTPNQKAEGPTMFVAAPVKSDTGQIVAVLGLRMKPEEEFTQIFSVARMGETGESYAFDRQALMLTASRFEPELKEAGLIPNTPETTAILNLRLVDPGFDLGFRGPLDARKASLVENKRPKGPPDGTESRAARRGGTGEGSKRLPRLRTELPLTRMAAAAVKGKDGVDVKGYRNYRGVKVVGAWAWLAEYGMGVATEVSVAEAFQPLYVLRLAFLVLILLLALSGIAIFVFTLLVERLQASVRKNALTAHRLGQYVLVEEIGRGANGMVYRARHSLLRRPVAVKLLSPELTNETTAARFEQEVQMTSQLTHPNTVAVYDYGRTPEGLFYYAMEYLSGIDLDQLVKRFGPQPEGRVIHILRQVCGSLAEAHRIGLIHRDIKPANIVLTRRGGVCDLVKVLDFGLVKARHLEAPDRRSEKAVVGTPHFMAPEAIEKPESVDGLSDLYSLGAVGYWLLTGKPMFEEREVERVFQHQVNTVPPRPSERLGQPVAADLEELIMRCLAKSPEQRLPSAEALDEALLQCVSAGVWTVRDAASWWQANLAGVEVRPPATMPEKTLVIAPRT